MRSHKTLLNVGIVLVVLACIVTLLGLLGTVGGMIHSFEVVAESDTPQPSQLARGISRAMFATLAGMVGGAVLGVLGLIFLVVGAIGLGRTRKQPHEYPEIDDRQ